MRRRTSVSGDLASRYCRTVRRSSSCSSEKAKFICVPLSRFSGEPEHPFADDVALDLTRASVDRLGPAGQEDAFELVRLVGTFTRRFDREGVGALDTHCCLAEVAMPRRPEELADAGLGTERALLHQIREHAHAVVLHDLQTDVALRELVAQSGLGCRAVLLRSLQEVRVLAFEGEL